MKTTQPSNRSINNSHGFTLFEIMTTLAIISILAVGVSPHAVKVWQKEKLKTASRDLIVAMRLAQKEAMYRSDNIHFLIEDDKMSIGAWRWSASDAEFKWMGQTLDFNGAEILLNGKLPDNTLEFKTRTITYEAPNGDSSKDITAGYNFILNRAFTYIYDYDDICNDIREPYSTYNLRELSKEINITIQNDTYTFEGKMWVTGNFELKS